MTWNYSVPIISERDFEGLSLLTVVDPYGRSKTLTKNLVDSRVFPNSRLPPTVVTMNSQVILQDTDTNRRFQIALVYPFNAQPEIGKISIDSDLGSRLLGLQVGQVFLAQAPDGKIKRLAIISIPYQPEAAGTLE
jgi:regulator of nucleoside diphosphate kinase